MPQPSGCEPPEWGKARHGGRSRGPPTRRSAVENPAARPRAKRGAPGWIIAIILLIAFLAVERMTFLGAIVFAIVAIKIAGVISENLRGE